jgi:hypothetical protein
MDNCSSTLNPAAVELLTRARVRIIPFALHTTYIFQMLDLPLFDGLKWRGQYRFPFRNFVRRNSIAIGESGRSGSQSSD